MPTEKTIEVIRVTADVYEWSDAVRHYLEEQKAGLYKPLMLVFTKRLHGRDLETFCVCRVPDGPNDSAFIATMRRQAQANKRKEEGVVTVPTSRLYIVVDGSLRSAAL